MPSLVDGTLMVATSPSTFSYEDQSSFPTGLIAVNPSTGDQPPIATGNLFSLPTYIAQGPNQQLYVSDLSAFGTGAILQVDPNTGQQRLVAKGGFINGPNALVYLDGYLYVANEGDASGIIHNLVQVNPSTGEQRLISDGSDGVGFSVPTGMVLGPGHNVYVTDEPGNVASLDPGKIWEINLDTGQQTLFSDNNDTQGWLFNHPVDLALDGSGNLIVINTGSTADAYSGSVIRVDPQTGVQTLVSSFAMNSGLDCGDVGPDGTIYVGTISAGDTPGQIYAVDPVTGAQNLIASGNQLSEIEGVRIFHAPGVATATTVVSSANPSTLGQWVTFTANVSAQGSGTGTLTGTVQFQIDGSNVGNPVSVTAIGGMATASFSTPLLTLGSHTVTALYSGDSTFAASAGILSGGQTVVSGTGIVTATTVSSSASASVFGQGVTFTATINVPDLTTGTPTGTVQFQIDGSNVGSPVSVSTTGGVATASFTTTLNVGTHTVTALYSGDSLFASSSGALAGGQTVSKANTSLIVTSSANPLVSGQSVTFTAIISIIAPGGGTPTGTVQFQIDGSNVGSPVSVSTLNGLTTASFSTAALAAGTHTISASYSGDGSFSSTSGGLPGGQTVTNITGAATTTSVRSSANASVFGQIVTFTATISIADGSSGIPSGIVQFQIDGINVGDPVSVSTIGGLTTASFSTTALPVGTHIVTAYYSGDSSFTASTGTLLGGQTVSKASTSLVVISSVTPSAFGQSVTFTAILSVQSPGAGTPTGTVQFQIDGSNVGSPVNVSTLGGWTTASFSTAALAAGTHTISVSYSGDGSFTSTSGSLSGGQTVSKASTSLTLTSSASAAVFGQGITFTATVTVQGTGTPSGTVQFQIDGSNAGDPVSVTTSGGLTIASFSTSGLPVGTHLITAYYSGDGTFAAGTGTLASGQTVSKASTSLVITSSASPSVFGQNVIFTVSISVTAPGAGTPTGTVQFQIDGSNAGSPVSVSTSGGLATASLSTTALAVGSHTVTASYSGDSTSAAGTGTLAGGQTVSKASTNLGLTTSANLLPPGQTVTFTALISVQSPGAGTPTGTVQFQIDGSNAGSPVSVSTAGGVTTATYSTAALTAGTHTISASYSGDGSFSSTSGSLSGGQTVSKASTSLTLTSSASPAVFGQSVTFTATLTVQGAGTPSGTVQFQIDGSNAGSPVSVSTTGGVTTASFSSATLTVATHTITASYGGDGSFAASTGTLTGGQQVNQAGTSMAVRSSANPLVSGQSVTFTATVSVQSPGAGAPTGTVQFQVDGSNVGNPISVSTAGGVTTASFSSTTLTVGSHTVTSSYSGDGNFTGSTGTLSGGQQVTNGNVNATLDSSTGLLSITGDSGNNAITITQASSRSLQIAGVGTTINQSSNSASFNAVKGITISFLNGSDSVTLTKFSIDGSISITTGSGSDSIALDTIGASLISIMAVGPAKDSITVSNTTTGATKISAGDNATLSMNDVNSGSVQLTAGNNATVSVNRITVSTDVNINVGDNAQSVTMKASNVSNLNIVQTGTTGSPSFDLEHDSIGSNLYLSAGGGNNTVTLSYVDVRMQLLVYLGAGKNTVIAEDVTARFGVIDGGPGGNNRYIDGGGNSGYSTIHFLR